MLHSQRSVSNKQKGYAKKNFKKKGNSSLKLSTAFKRNIYVWHVHVHISTNLLTYYCCLYNDKY